MLSSMGQNVLYWTEIGNGQRGHHVGTRSRALSETSWRHERIDEVLTQLTIVFGSSLGGVDFTSFQNLSEREKRILLDQLSSLKQHFDYMLIDTARALIIMSCNFKYFGSRNLRGCDARSFKLADAYALLRFCTRIKEKSSL